MERRTLTNAPSRIQAIELRIAELEREQVEVADELRELRALRESLRHLSPSTSLEPPDPAGRPGSTEPPSC
jgi:hypothetical protein